MSSTIFTNAFFMSSLISLCQSCIRSCGSIHVYATAACACPKEQYLPCSPDWLCSIALLASHQLDRTLDAYDSMHVAAAVGQGAELGCRTPMRFCKFASHGALVRSSSSAMRGTLSGLYLSLIHI